MKKLTLFLSLFTLLLLPASQTIDAQQLGQKVYWMATIEVPVGQLSAYHAFAEKELVPLQEKHGYHFIATWQTIVGDIEEVLVICEFESMAAYGRIGEKGVRFSGCLAVRAGTPQAFLPACPLSPSLSEPE